MALRRNIGGLTTISPGVTHHWEYSYSPHGRDVGVAIAAPNILQDSINIERIADQQRVVAREGGEATAIAYRVAILNAGGFALSYNLNIGDWL
ncbi:MAG TPA: hypothetical protein VF319_14525 [Caldimonas sp.]